MHCSGRVDAAENIIAVITSVIVGNGITKCVQILSISLDLPQEVAALIAKFASYRWSTPTVRDTFVVLRPDERKPRSVRSNEKDRNAVHAKRSCCREA